LVIEPFSAIQLRVSPATEAYRRAHAPAATTTVPAAAR
jgi:hypothetical protein